MAGDNAIFWEDIEPRIDIEPFCTSCKISSTKKKSRSKNTLKLKSTFKCVFMYIISATATKILNNETSFPN